MRNLISLTCLAVLVVSGIVLTQNEPAEVVAQSPVQAANPLAATVSELTKIAADQQERIEALERRQSEFKSCECGDHIADANKKVSQALPKEPAKQTAPQLAVKTVAPSGWTCGPNGCTYNGSRSVTTQRRGLFGRRR